MLLPKIPDPLADHARSAGHAAGCVFFGYLTSHSAVVKRFFAQAKEIDSRRSAALYSAAGQRFGFKTRAMSDPRLRGDDEQKRKALDPAFAG